MSTVYFAAPYSSAANKDERMENFMRLTGEFMLKNPGLYSVSPLFNHYSLKHCLALGDDWAFWEGYSKNLLNKLDAAAGDFVVVLTFPRWVDSTGVIEEMGYAYERGLDVYLVDPENPGIALKLKKELFQMKYQHPGYIFLGDTKPLLSSAQIQDRLKRFNDNNDWTVFDDVPESQAVNVMYPHTFKFLYPKTKESDIEKIGRKMALNCIY